MKITYNVTGPARKELVKAIAHLLAVASVYQGPPSYAYNIGGYIVDRNGNLITPDEATTDDVFRLVDALYAEYEYKPEEPLSELFPDEETDSEETDVEPEEEEPEADEAESSDNDEEREDGEIEDEAEDTDEEPEAESPEEPEPEAHDAPEIALLGGDSPASEDDTEEAGKAPESGDSAPDEGEETVEGEAAESAEETEEAEVLDEAENSDDSRLTLSLPKDKFSPTAIERLKALVSSKQTLLKKVFDAQELPIVVTDDQIQFPWFTLQGVDGEVDAYAKFIYLMAKRALASSRISATEKPTDNDKFTMRLFLNNLGFKGEEFKFARRFLIRNLEGNGAWRYGNAPDASSFDLEMPTVVAPAVSTPEEPVKSDPEPEEEETDVGDEEEESDDEE